MARMKAIDAAVRVLEREGINTAFGVPGAAINPLYAALTATPVRSPATSASASALRGRRART